MVLDLIGRQRIRVNCDFIYRPLPSGNAGLPIGPNPANQEIKFAVAHEIYKRTAGLLAVDVANSAYAGTERGNHVRPSGWRESPQTRTPVEILRIIQAQA